MAKANWFAWAARKSYERAEAFLAAQSWAEYLRERAKYSALESRAIACATKHPHAIAAAERAERAALEAACANTYSRMRMLAGVAAGQQLIARNTLRAIRKGAPVS